MYVALAFAYLAALNIVTFWQFGHDKMCAVNGFRRTPEAELLRLAILGGTIGAFAARHILRHKTRKQPFSTYLQLIAVVQAGLLIGILAAGLA